MLADPQDFVAAGNLIQEHRVELEYLADLIQWRLKLREQEHNQWNLDNPFYWRFTLQDFLRNMGGLGKKLTQMCPMMKKGRLPFWQLPGFITKNAVKTGGDAGSRTHVSRMISNGYTIVTLN